MSITGSSLSEARQLYQYAVSTNEQIDAIERKMRSAKVTYADVYNALQDIFMIMRRSGLPEDVVEAMALLQRLIAVMNAMRIAVVALNAAMAGSPAGIALAAVGVAASTLSAVSMIGSYG